MFNLSKKNKLATQSNYFTNYSQLLPDSTISRILIADEESEVRDALSVAVRRWAQEEQRNIEIILVENGEQAVDYVETIDENNSLFLAILDLRMPQMNGLESARIISDRRPNMPIIITVSHNEIDEKLIKDADDFADYNSHMSFMIRTNSPQVFKLALESEIKKIEFIEENIIQENSTLLGNLKGKLTAILN